MSHTLYRISLRPLTAFATPLRGDTLFGQCAWFLRQARGESFLRDCLVGYREGHPFLVLSDAFPQGYLPRPCVPLHLLGFDLSRQEMRKQIKGRRWLPVSALHQPMVQWHHHLCHSAELAAALQRPGQCDADPVWTQLWLESPRTHNSLNRMSNTTGKGEGFAPYDRNLRWYHPGLVLDIYAVIDARLSAADLHLLLESMGQFGYGKEASSGLGKFEVVGCDPWLAPAQPTANTWLTLAPCAPQQGDWRVQDCYYEVHVRFGRHGVQAAQSVQTPWKNPVMMADSAAILTPARYTAETYFVGQGIDGISLKLPDTVHQGYSPVVPVILEDAGLLKEGCA